MSTDADLMAMVNGMAEQLERWAEIIDRIQPSIRSAREALFNMGPAAARMSEFPGTVDQIDAAVADEFGFTRFDAARLRVIAALYDPMDDVPRPID